MSGTAKTDPFARLARRQRWTGRLRRWRDALLRPVRPARIDPQRRGHPNLVLIGVDTLRSDHLGLGGSTAPTSPNLDRLAAGGTIFGDVTSMAPWTLPSFCSALTGMMPSLHSAQLTGAVRNMDTQPPHPLDGNLPTLAARLREQGYRTAAFYSNQFFAFGLAESFDHHAYHNLAAADLVAVAQEWIRRHADRPFFCFVLLNDPHEPTTPTARDLEPFLPRARAAGADPSVDRLARYARWGEDGAARLGDPPPGDEPGETAPEHTHGLVLKRAIYDATIREVDRAIGGLQAQIEAWDLASTTLVSVFSDHGEEFCEHARQARAWNHDPRGIAGIGHGHSHFQELLHVPWVAWGAGVPAGVRRREPVSLGDLAPTLMEWLGFEPPARDADTDEVTGALYGRSVAKPRPENGQDDRLLLSEAIAYGPDLVALRRGPWKFIAHRDGRPLGLYRLSSDPGEQFDLGSSRPEVVEEFSGLLARWRQVATTQDGAPDSGTPSSWNDMDDTVRQRLKDLGYSD